MNAYAYVRGLGLQLSVTLLMQQQHRHSKSNSENMRKNVDNFPSILCVHGENDTDAKHLCTELKYMITNATDLTSRCNTQANE